MTIEQLLALPVPDLAAMSEQELEQHLLPYFPTTRPQGTFEIDIPVEIQEILNKRREKSTIKISVKPKSK
jgi:hypothetical protein